MDPQLETYGAGSKTASIIKPSIPMILTTPPSHPEAEAPSHPEEAEISSHPGKAPAKQADAPNHPKAGVRTVPWLLVFHTIF